MDDQEVLLENDPLAIYLRKQEINDFETTKITFFDRKNEIIESKKINKDCNLSEDYQLCLDKILKSELLLEEDYNILEIYYLNNDISTNSILPNISYKNTILSSLSIIGLSVFKYIGLKKYIKVIIPVCSLPIVFKLYTYIQKKIKNRIISVLLIELRKFTNSIQKYLRLIVELSFTIGYYSSASLAISSINTVYIRFVKELYTDLLSVIKALVYHCMELTSLIPLSIQNNLQYGMKQNLFLKEDISITDLKLLFELYLLVQSDFIKTLGLSFCNYLWVNPNCDFNRVTASILPLLLSSLKEKSNILEKQYKRLYNYGTSKRTVSKSPRRFKNLPSYYMVSCLHNTELHFQQLLCKSRDLQKILKEAEETADEKGEIIAVMLHELEKQLNSSKNMLESVTKYFNQIQKKSVKSKPKVIMPQDVLNSTLKTVESQDAELSKQEKLTYELYIPKEGVDLDELETNTERPVFNMNELDYSAVLLEELKTILKARNPEIFEEQVNSDTEDEDSFSTPKNNLRDIFRPIQPVGLAENLQNMNHVFAAQPNKFKCQEETFGSSDSDGN